MYFLRILLGSHRRPQAAIIASIIASFCFIIVASAMADNPYGPENLLKTLPTPFTSRAKDDEDSKGETDTLAPLAIPNSGHPFLRGGWKERFNTPRLFLPERMTIGKTAEFLIKGSPGMYAAIAMADKNAGAKPICGHKLRLGPDRKLVAVGKIPESGVLSLFVEAPIQGDLIGEPLYFEAAIWSRPDFSDMQLASTISPEQTGSTENAVLIAGESLEKKRGLFVLDQHRPISTSVSTGGVHTDKP